MPHLPASPAESGQAKRKRELEAQEDPFRGEAQFVLSRHKHKHLRIEIPSSGLEKVADQVLSSTPLSGISVPDSLFDESEPTSSSWLIPALLTAPLIPGLFFTPTLLLPEEIADAVTRFCLDTYFHSQSVNQVMLFGRFSPTCSEPNPPSSSKVSPSDPAGIPPVLIQLLSTLDDMLLPLLPPYTHDLLFPRVPRQARQVILNLYQPGEGISPHVDLLRRFGDGIVGVSLGSGCVMQFAKVDGSHDEQETKQRDLYLPARSVIVLSQDARYEWTHGIGKHKEDYVAVAGSDLDGSAGQWIKRGVRLSITFRWLLPGAHIVGED